MSNFEASLRLHESHRGKLMVQSTVPITNFEDLSLAYTPGVAAPCQEIAKERENLYKYTIKGNTVAVVTDGSAVLGLGNIGAEASLPVMEGKCALFQRFAGINAFPLCITTQNVDKFVEIVKQVVTPFGGINLEDIRAPYCFEIESRLKDELDIPVFHDDQHGTAIVVLAALINSLKLTDRTFEKTQFVISGSGAAGISIANLLLAYGSKNIILCDRHGALSTDRDDLPDYKQEIAERTNPDQKTGTLVDVLEGADVFIGVSAPQLLDKTAIATMAKDAIVFALANPTPEIMPEQALAGGALIVGTGRSDFPNQINNVLAFPGVFRGVLDARVRDITPDMYVAAAEALAQRVKNPVPDKIIPDIFDDGVVDVVATAVKNCCL